MKANTRFCLVFISLILAASIVPAAEQGMVNINTASAEQLQLLPRVGPALASRIIEFRTTNGPFKAVEELVAVRGVGENSMKTLKPYLCVDGKTTLTAKVRIPRKKPSNK